MPAENDFSGETPSDYHVPVLLHEAVDALQIKKNGIYVDCTFGGGGHSKEILRRLGDDGRLIVFDQDADAKANIPPDPRVVFIDSNFRHLHRFLRLHGFLQVDGVLADLGVSSHQFNEPVRGFSTRFEGPLDMRMDQRQELSAAAVLRSYSEQKLHKLFEQYGEITNAKTLAHVIVEQRGISSMDKIEQLKNIVRPVVKGNPNKYWAQLFQALRIEVNKEMEALEEMLAQVPLVLKSKGRVAVITFHSIEDRIVKRFFRQQNSTNETNPFSNVKEEPVLKTITKKPIEASLEEVKRNPRSRSAKMRVAEKI